MDGREMERFAQRNKNWAKTGFVTPEPVKQAEPIPEPVKRAEPDPVVRAEATPESVKLAEPVPSEPAKLSIVKGGYYFLNLVGQADAEAPTAREGITAIKIDGRLHSIREPSDSDTPADKLNLELLGFMFGAYGRHGLLPISDLAEFVKRNNLMAYLEVKMTPANQEQFDKRISDLLVRGLAFEETRQEIKNLFRQKPEFAVKSKLLSLWIGVNAQELIRLMD